MFSFFTSKPFNDSQFGELRRSRGRWRGKIMLETESQAPLILSGGRSAPDAETLRIARTVPADYPSWRTVIEKEMFEHYSPYAEAVAAGEEDAPSLGLPHIEAPSEVWPHTTLEYVAITPLDGILTVEIGYRVAWDEEHTLGARFQGGQMLELCGSVLTP